jgi:N-acetylmuramoyl-L-alanine amidase
MKNFLALSIAVIASTTLGIISTFSGASAVDFGQQEVDQKKFVAISVPHVGSSPHLVVLEQISNSQSCWRESGTSPVTVEALLLKFDFTGICKRSTDGNGYSIRMAGQDLAMLYKLKIVKQNSEFVLVGISNTDPNAPAIKIGSTQGIGEGLTKIKLEPGWRFTKRTYNGQSVDHIYLTSDLAAPSSHLEQHKIGTVSVRTGREMSTSTSKKNPTTPTAQQTNSTSTLAGNPAVSTGYPRPTNANPSIVLTSNPSQPVSPVISAQISAALAAKGLTLASCSANPGVVIMMASYMACAYPTDIYPAGRYSLTF